MSYIDYYKLTILSIYKCNMVYKKCISIINFDIKFKIVIKKVSEKVIYW